MNNKKEQEREELHKTIWKIANDLRGSVDGWDFKQYVLGLLFYRFISENIENYVNENQRKAGEVNFEYRHLSDEEAILGKSQILTEKGLFILPSELFCNVRKNAKNNDNLNVTIANIFDNIESSAKGTASEDDVKGLFDDFDVKGNKLGNTVEERNEKLVKMLDAIGDLDLGDYQDNAIDTFGDAYEFLMTMYASHAGKSGGEFFTPQEVGELLARIVIGDKKEVNKVYDPACGSGGLLLKFAKILGKENVRQGFFGQEINLTTYNLARINMFLHDINYNHFNIAREDTLIHPKHWDDEPFDAIVSNPPYSIKWAGKSNPLLINDERFAPAGVLAPESKADLAFTMHMLSWLSPKGTAAIVEFPGVLYRGGAEQKIRKYMIDNNFVDTVIQLPSDLFFGTSIATCILVLKKNKVDNNILFVDASEEFVRNTNKNKLSDENINNIVNLLKDRKSVDNKAYLAPYEEIKENDYNISVNSYLKKITEEEQIDIKELNKQIKEIVEKENFTRTELDKIIAELEFDQMSKIEQLIKEKCPNGVKFYKLSEISEKFSGLSGKTKADFDNGNCRYISYTNLYNNPSINLKANDYVNIKSNEKQNDIKFKDILIAGSSENLEDSGMVSVVTNKPSEKIYLNSFCFGLRLTSKYFDMYNADFLKHLFRSKVFRNQITRCSFGVTRYNLSKDKLLKIKIPLPPIEVQEEIVKILDKFSELERTLKTELEERKKQYEFWRNILFKNIHNIKMLKISEFAKCIVGATPSTKKIEYWQNGTINWMSSGEVNYGQITSVKKKITTLGYQNSSTKMLPINTVVVALAGQGKTRGTVAITRIPLCTNQSLCGIIPDGNVINNDYLYYYLQSRYKDLRNISAGDGTRGGLNLKMISTYKIPVPPLQEQERIVNILDKFDKLINDISEGIPAEIEARRKQYEYYRNKLLSFEEYKNV